MLFIRTAMTIMTGIIKTTSEEARGRGRGVGAEGSGQVLLEK